MERGSRVVAEADMLPIEAAADVQPRGAGEKLRAAREAMGLSLADICAVTKINQRHLAAVESGDFAALPARIYAVGFGRSYAGAVGLEPSEIAAEIRRELDGRDALPTVRPHDLDLDDPTKVPTRRLVWLSLLLALGLVVAIAVYWRSYFVPAVDLPPVRPDPAPAAAAPAPPLGPAASLSPTAESAAGLPSPLDPTASGAASAPAAQPAPVARRSTAPAARPSAAAVADTSPPAPAPAASAPAPAPSPSASSSTG